MTSLAAISRKLERGRQCGGGSPGPLRPAKKLASGVPVSVVVDAVEDVFVRVVVDIVVEVSVPVVEVIVVEILHVAIRSE